MRSGTGSGDDPCAPELLNMPTEPGPELNLLLDWQADRSPRRLLRDGLGSLLIHAVLIGLCFLLAWLPTDAPAPREDTIEVHQVTRLVAPPLRLTQRTPPQGKLAQEVNLDDLLAQNRRAVPPQPRRPAFVPPQPARGPLPKPAPAAVAPPPRMEAMNRVTPMPPLGANVQAPPPRIQQEEPKLALQNPGSVTPDPGMRIDFGRMPVHRMSVDEAVQGAALQGGGGIAVGDPEEPPMLKPDIFGQTPSQLRNTGRLELLSDPQGIDFKAYLTRVLISVKKNWLAIIPESARLGRRGLVVVQFIISRNGEVPKLVISMPSGTEAFDRAAVAGVSASNPFPPLPSDYRGNDIRVQLSFSYNVPRR